MPAVSLEQIASLCKRRGIIYPGSEIYGGLQGTYDYGPVGVELKNNIVDSWWRTNVYERDDMEGLDAAILMNPLTWNHSGLNVFSRVVGGALSNVAASEPAPYQSTA